MPGRFRIRSVRVLCRVLPQERFVVAQPSLLLGSPLGGQRRPWAADERTISGQEARATTQVASELRLDSRAILGGRLLISDHPDVRVALDAREGGRPIGERLLDVAVTAAVMVHEVPTQVVGLMYR